MVGNNNSNLEKEHMLRPTLLCAALALSFGTVQAATVSASADAYVQSNGSLDPNAANRNFGAADGIAIKSDTAVFGQSRKGYIRFGLSQFANSVTNVQLELAFNALARDPTLPNANPSTYSVFGLNDGSPGEDWDELELTWNNAPGNNTGSVNGVLSSEAQNLGTFSFNPLAATAGDSILFSTDELTSFINADTNDLATLIITRNDINFSIEAFGSRESAAGFAPQLSAVPIPAALPLLLSGLGLVGLMSHGHKRKV